MHASLKVDDSVRLVSEFSGDEQLFFGPLIDPFGNINRGKISASARMPALHSLLRRVAAHSRRGRCGLSGKALPAQHGIRLR